MEASLPVRLARSWRTATRLLLLLLLPLFALLFLYLPFAFENEFGAGTARGHRWVLVIAALGLLYVGLGAQRFLLPVTRRVAIPLGLVVTASALACW